MRPPSQALVSGNSVSKDVTVTRMVELGHLSPPGSYLKPFIDKGLMALFSTKAWRLPRRSVSLSSVVTKITSIGLGQTDLKQQRPVQHNKVKSIERER
ncbi:hypothetical protein SAY87_027947 [Trapa incisa]|uniref:Uncharacterized protein n=1 Tax=Trapa incisa TaxID=236973 RepID=A0AAN7KYW5_9MYRT|nr:hypothetical protein SAY87_027947 [Trapa incisa]